MKYGRALVLADLRADPTCAMSALRRLAPTLERVIVVARLARPGTWWSAESPRAPDSAEQQALEVWRAAGAASAPSVDLITVAEVHAEALVDLALTENVDLFVAGTPSFEIAGLLNKAARRLLIATLWPAGNARTGPIERFFCAAIGERALAAIISFLREHTEPSHSVVVLGPAALPTEALNAALEVLGLGVKLEVLPRQLGSLRLAVMDAPGRDLFDLFVLPSAPTLLLVGFSWPAPVLSIPLEMSAQRRPRPFDITDVIEVAGKIRARVDEVTTTGTLLPATDWEIGFFCEGRVVATASPALPGEVELTAASARWLGAVRVVGDEPPHPLSALEQRFEVLRPREQPLCLFDAELPAERLRALVDLARASGEEPLAVRLRPVRRAVVIRERLRAAALPARVIDARAVLDEGDAYDVSESNDGVRLRRVAARMRAAGFVIGSVLDRQSERPQPLVETITVVFPGNRIDVELDNARARGWLLDAICGSRHSLNLQVYMATDDEIGRAVESELVKAAARGVTVRLLVDSLHGLHGSYGVENPLLARLAARPGIELRVYRPLSGLPSLTGFKQRDHRKIVICDEALALIGGRNIAHEYYTGFDEQPLNANMPWRTVPWLDAGARVEGPAVAAIACSFLDAWTEAGGAPFSIFHPAPVGSVAARVVVHHGLRDANTLESYLELIESARRHIFAVNGFPYLLELQHALLRALGRGIRVRVMTGQLLPTHEGQPFPGPWSSGRNTAVDLVHSRLDPLVEAGAEVYVFAQRSVPGWDENLGVVHQHVHAKLMSVDGVRVAVGSANFDVTSAYWESELMVVVEDVAVAQACEQRLEQLFATSTRINGDDPNWRERARRRSWMRRWPGILGI